METIAFKIGNHTDLGLVREKNEDYYGNWKTINGHLLIVCDGMGGHAGGDVASRLAVEAMHEFFDRKSYDNIVVALQQSLEYANSKIRALVAENPQLDGMGTTAVLALIRNNKVYYAHLGDSRIYIFSQNVLKQLTKDHSFVQQLVDNGLITSKEAERHPKKNQITKALGIDSQVEPDISEQPYEPAAGDYLMLCTDGLSGQVSDESISTILRGEDQLQNKVIRLIEAANNNGGPDNSTVQVVYFVGNPPAKQAVAASKKNFPLLLLIVAALIVASVFAYSRFSSVKDKLASNGKDSTKKREAIKTATSMAPVTVVKPVPDDSTDASSKIDNTKIVAEPTIADTVLVYTIQSGDNTTSLKKKFNSGWEEMKKFDTAYKQSAPTVGSKIRIRVKGMETFEKGEKLDSLLTLISSEYKIQITEIKEANDWMKKNPKAPNKIIVPVKEK